VIDWIPNWIPKKVSGVYIVENALPRIVFRQENETIPVFALDQTRVTEFHVRDALAIHRDLRFIVNATKEALYDGDALGLCEQQKVGLGELGELVSFLDGTPRNHIQRDARFVLRSLRQHSLVESVTRENNRMYVVRCRSHSKMRVLVLHDYLVTADSVRNGLETFGVPNVIAKANPNGTITNEAMDAAKSAGLEVLTWAELFRSLSKQWT